MRYCFLTLAVLSALLVAAQKPAVNNTTYEFTKVVRADSGSAAQLYLNAKRFIASAFQGVRETAQLKDDKTKTIATKGSFPVSVTGEDGSTFGAKTYFTLVIQAKDGMYKYTFTDFYYAYREVTGSTSYASFNDKAEKKLTAAQWAEVRSQTADFVSAFAEDLVAEMLDGITPPLETVTAKKDDKPN